jgi:hypothetical protein
LLLPPARVDGSAGGRFGVHDAAPATTTAVSRPPTRPAATGTARPSPTIFRLSAGFNLANLAPPERVIVDAGAGYIFNDIGWGDRKIHGLYAEVSPIISRQKGWWVTFTARGEAMFPDSRESGMGYGFIASLGVETFSFTESPAGFAADGKGFGIGAAYGTLAIGAFAEAGAQRLPGGEQQGILLGGISVRLPATAGVYCCVIPK